MKKLLLVSLCFLMLSITQVFAQNRNFTGTVTSKDDGLPIPGVTVKIKGTKKGAQTTSAGTFSISAPSDAILEFSYLGYVTKDVTVGASSNIIVVLESQYKELNEVVVTSLGIRREKKALGYSVQEVKGDDLVKAGETDALKALAGKVAGVQVTAGSGSPGGGVYIQIRGMVSISGNNQPLFVIDGIPIDNSNNITALGGGATATQTNRAVDINPDDIANVSVLKGPAAAALYGINAAAGAIIITTKKGQAGKTQVDFSTGISFNKENRLPKEQDEFIKGLGSVLSGSSAYTSSNRYSWGPNADTLYWDGVPNDFDRHGNIVGASNPNAKIKFTPYNNEKDFFQTGAQYDNSFAISGGDDISTFRAGVTNTYQNSIIPLQYFQRTTISLAGTLNVSKRLKASASMSYTGSNGSEPQEGSNLAGIMLPLLRTPISFDNSNGVSDPANNPKAYYLSDGVTQRDYRNGVNYDNPYFSINKNPYTTNIGRTIGSLQLDYNIGGGFSALYRLGGDMYQDNRKQVYDVVSGAAPGGEIIEDRYTYHSLNSDLILAYTKKLNDFQFDAKIGNNFNGHKTDELSVTGTGLSAPGFNNLANAGTINAGQESVPVRSYSFYYDLNLSYKDYLFLETTGRNDHVSTLPSTANSFFYPSVDLSFVFSELGDLKNSSVLSLGKIRASYVQVGNAAPPFSTTSGYTTSGFADGFTQGITYPSNGLASYSLAGTEGNPDLKPELSTAYELGTQLQFFGNRLGLDASVYYDKSTNNIISVTLPGSTGYNATVLNSGSIRNKGFELQLSGTEVKSQNFTWSSFINFSLNRNKVLAIAPGLKEIDFAGFTGATQSDIVGLPANVIYGVGYVNSGKNIVIDDNPGGNPGYPLTNPSQLKVIGNPNPKFLAGWGNTLKFKNLSLYTLVDWKFKGDIWDGTRGALVAYGRAEETVNRGSSTVFKGVLGHINSSGQLVHYAADGVTELPGAGAANTSSVVLNQAWYEGDGGGFGSNDQQFVEDGSFVKLREVTLSYDFSSLLGKNPGRLVKNLSAGLFARNIIIWTPYKGVDPETSLNSGVVGGEDYFNNPGAANFGVNVKVKF